MPAEVTTVPEPPSDRPAADRPSIVDLVFAGELPGRRRRLLAGTAAVVGLYASVVVLLNQLGRSAAPWGAEMAARVHDAIAVERAVDITAPSPPTPPPAEAPIVEARRVQRAARSPASRDKPAAPAQPGRLAAATPSPLDFTGSAFIVGTGSSYAGGKTTSTGTSRTAAVGNVAPAGTGDGAAATRSRARPVSLDQSAWTCPWPAEADAQQVDEQTVVLRVTVRADGRAERVDVVGDPGYGFGPAARQCALGTRFEPARDGAGQPVTALSPPIRVHFFR
jgi:protein TonB